MPSSGNGTGSPETNSVRRNVSSTCNSSGSALWTSAKNIKPLVDANFHTEVIESAYHQSPIRFSPIYYQNPGFMSGSPNGQTILFGRSLKLRTIGKLKKIPPVLEYLLDSVYDWPTLYIGGYKVGQKSTEIGQLTHFILSQGNAGSWWMRLNKRGQVWRKAIVLSFHHLSKPSSGTSFWFACSNTSIQEAKRPYRNTFGPFQSQYCQMMISHWL